MASYITVPHRRGTEHQTSKHLGLKRGSPPAFVDVVDEGCGVWARRVESDGEHVDHFHTSIALEVITWS